MLYQEREAQVFKRRYKELTQGKDIPFLGTLLQRTARNLGTATAIIYEDVSITYTQLYYAATLISQKLREQGIKPKDRVILLYENVPEFYSHYFGILQVGAVVVPLNVFLQTQEIAHILDDAQPTLIIVSPSLASSLQDTATQRSIPVWSTQNSIPLHIPTVLTNFEVTSLMPDDMAALLYTSGTTGTPKGVMLSSRNVFTNILQAIVRFEPKQTDKVFAVLPLFHSFAQSTCVWAACFMGCTVILVPKIDRRAILKGLAHKPTILVGVPALFGLLCLMKTAPLDDVTICVSGGDALPDRLRALFALIYRRKLCNGYGLTEASPFISCDISDELVSAAHVGHCLTGITCAIKNERGEIVPDGTIGELWVKGDNVMLGYYKAPEMTASVIKDGWLSTGDLAFLDYKKRIVITGRYKDLIIHKGFNIYPQEIENVLLLHPDVLRAAVIGCPDDIHGEIPIAYLQLKQENLHIVEQLETVCKKNLAAYKIPRYFNASIDPLPLTATGKIDKKTLKKQIKHTNKS